MDLERRREWLRTTVSTMSLAYFPESEWDNPIERAKKIGMALEQVFELNINQLTCMPMDVGQSNFTQAALEILEWVAEGKKMPPWMEENRG